MSLNSNSFSSSDSLAAEPSGSAQSAIADEFPPNANSVFSQRKWKKAMLTAAIAGDALAIKGLLRHARAHKQSFHVFDPDGLHPLFVAARGGHAECVRLLLPHWNPDSLRIENRHEKGLNHENQVEMMESYWRMTPFLVAAEHGHVECLKILREESDPAIVDGMGFTALMNAVREDHFEAFEYLAGFANLDERRLPEGSTAMMIAATNNHEKFIDALLEMGANPNLTDQATGRTAMSVAFSHTEKAKPMVEKLMRVTDLSIEDKAGRAALHQAVDASDFNGWILPLIARFMPTEEFARQIRKKDSQGMTPLVRGCLSWAKNPAAVNCLLSFGRAILTQDEIDGTMGILMDKAQVMDIVAEKATTAIPLDALAFDVSDTVAERAWQFVVRGIKTTGGAESEERLREICPRLSARMESLTLQATVEKARETEMSANSFQTTGTAEPPLPLRKPRAL